MTRTRIRCHPGEPTVAARSARHDIPIWQRPVSREVGYAVQKSGDRPAKWRLPRLCIHHAAPLIAATDAEMPASVARLTSGFAASS